MGWRFNPFTSNFDFVDSSTSIVDSATKLKIIRIASEAILSQDVLRAFSPTHCALATGDSSVDQAIVLGIADNDAAIGENVDIILLGVVTSTDFSIFTLNAPLFLDIDGGITDTKRTSGYHAVIGDSLGGNDIMFRPEKPIKIS